MVNGSATGAVLHGFSFYTLENKRSANLKKSVQMQAVKRQFSVLQLNITTIQLNVLHIGVGLDVARFTELGNAKASMRGTGDSTDSHAFSFIIRYTNLPNLGSL